MLNCKCLQAVGGLVIDTTNNKVLMLSSRKAEGAYRLPRGNCDENETPEQAVVRVLHDEAGVEVENVTQRVGTYTEANKKGKIVGHHWMFEVANPKLLDSWPALDRKRVWVSQSLRASWRRVVITDMSVSASSPLKKPLLPLLIATLLVWLSTTALYPTNLVI